MTRPIEPTSPIRETDAGARALASDLMHNSKTAALGVLIPGTGIPQVTRIAVLYLPAFGLCTLISDLSGHSAALRANPMCSLLLGDVPTQGDPLNHPRLTLQASASEADKKAHRGAWITARPKAKLYFDFADFRVFRFDITSGHLVGGFGKAFDLTSQDLPLPQASAT